LYDEAPTRKNIYPNEIAKFTLASSWRESTGLISIYGRDNPQDPYIENDRLLAGTKAVFREKKDLKIFPYNRNRMRDLHSESYVPDL